MRRLGKEIYEPLIWVFQNINICFIHHTYLVNNCPCCEKQLLILERRSQPGFCVYCKTWLGYPCKEEEINEWELSKELMVLEMIEYNDLFQKYDLIRSLKQLVCQFSNLNITDFARKLAVPKTTFWTWYSGNNTPTLDDVLRICNKFGISLVEFYTNNLVFEKAQIIYSKRKINVYKNQTQKSLYEVGKSAKSFVLDQGKKSISVTKMAIILECNKKTLYNHFPQQCKAQAKRSKLYRSVQRNIRLEKHFEEIKLSFLKILNTPTYPTSRKIAINLLKSGIFREAEVRNKLKMLKIEHGFR